MAQLIRVVRALSKRTTVRRDGGTLTLTFQNRAKVIDAQNDTVRSFWEALAGEGLTKTEAISLLSQLPPIRRATIWAGSDSLFRNGWVDERLLCNRAPLAERSVISAAYVPAGVTADCGLKLSRFACSRAENDCLQVESPLCHAVVRLLSDQAAATLLRLSSGCPPGSASGNDPESSLIRFFAETGLAVPTDSTGRTIEESDPVLRQWDYHDLFFHSRSRSGRHRNPFGRIARFSEEIEDLPPISPVGTGRILELRKPDLNRITASEPPFGKILDARRTVRTVPDSPLTLEMVAEFLYRSARIQQLNEATPAGSQRPFASAGGANELEIYLAACNCEDLEPGLYHYRPAEHVLECLSVSPDRLKPLLAYSGTEPVGIHVTIAARFQRLTWRYASLPYSLILKDVGCLMQTMYLVATVMGRAPCAIGTGNSDLFARLTGRRYEVEGSVGEFVLR